MSADDLRVATLGNELAHQRDAIYRALHAGDYSVVAALAHDAERTHKALSRAMEAKFASVRKSMEAERAAGRKALALKMVAAREAKAKERNEA